MHTAIKIPPEKRICFFFLKCQREFLYNITDKVQLTFLQHKASPRGWMVFVIVMTRCSLILFTRVFAVLVIQSYLSDTSCSIIHSRKRTHLRHCWSGANPSSPAVSPCLSLRCPEGVFTSHSADSRRQQLGRIT